MRRFNRLVCSSSLRPSAGACSSSSGATKASVGPAAAGAGSGVGTLLSIDRNISKPNTATANMPTVLQYCPTYATADVASDGSASGTTGSD